MSNPSSIDPTRVPSLFNELQNAMESKMRNKKYQTLAKEYLEIAKRDIEASKLLYEHQRYAQATFYLQQATEKTVKGVMLASGLTTPERARAVEHDATKLFSDLAVREPTKKMFGKLDEVLMANIPNYTRANVKAVLHATGKGFDADLAKLSSENITKLVKLFEGLENVLKFQGDRNIPLILAKKLYSVLNKKELQIEKLLVLPKLMILSRIICPHEASSRYPNDENGLKSQDYDNQTVGIVSCIPTLIQEIEKIQQYFKSVYLVPLK
jgi:HEPN domain-containing protein